MLKGTIFIQVAPGVIITSQLIFPSFHCLFVMFVSSDRLHISVYWNCQSNRRKAKLGGQALRCNPWFSNRHTHWLSDRTVSSFSRPFPSCDDILCISVVHNNGSSRRRHVYYIHYTDVIMGAIASQKKIASQITRLTIVYSTVYSDSDQRKHHSSASLAFVWGIHRGPVNSPHQWQVTRKMFPFDDVITWYT